LSCAVPLNLRGSILGLTQHDAYQSEEDCKQRHSDQQRSQSKPNFRWLPSKDEPQYCFKYKY